jgi:hypothetical protein
MRVRLVVLNGRFVLQSPIALVDTGRKSRSGCLWSLLSGHADQSWAAQRRPAMASRLIKLLAHMRTQQAAMLRIPAVRAERVHPFSHCK